MKLTRADREYLKRNFWEDEAHIDQIERAISFTRFELAEAGDDEKTVQITRERVLELLHRELFLAGMDRSAFHRTAAVSLEDGWTIYFDSSRFFKNA